MNIQAASPAPQSAAQQPAAPDQAHAADQDRRDEEAQAEPQTLTAEEQAALALHRRHLSEQSYLPAPVDYLHVR